MLCAGEPGGPQNRPRAHTHTRDGRFTAEGAIMQVSNGLTITVYSA